MQDEVYLFMQFPRDLLAGTNPVNMKDSEPEFDIGLLKKLVNASSEINPEKVVIYLVFYHWRF